MKKLSKMKVVKRGRRVIPNALLHAHRSKTSRFRCSHCKCDKCKANPVVVKKGTGMYRSWYKNGRLACEYFLRDGELNGLLRAWWPNGMPMEEQAYDMGEPLLIRLFKKPSGELNTEVTSDGCASHQRFFDSRTKKWRKYHVIHNKDVSRKEFLSFLKQQKNVLKGKIHTHAEFGPGH